MKLKFQEMLISLIVINSNFKETEEPSLTALGDLDWNDPYTILSEWFNKRIK